LHFDAGAVAAHVGNGSNYRHLPSARRNERLPRRHKGASRCRSFQSRTIGASPSRLPLALFLLHPFRCVVLAWPFVLAVVVVFLGVARSLPAVADLRVLTTVEYAVAVAAAVSVGDVLLLLSCAVGLSTW
jgi:hypothetical protein